MDAIAFAATIGGSVVALAGIGLTGWNAAKDRRHQRQLAGEARVYEARAKTYVDLLATLARMLREMEGAHPESQAAMTREARQRQRITEVRSKEEGLKELLAHRDERLRLEAQLIAFGSVAVRDATKAFYAAEDAFAANWTAPGPVGGTRPTAPRREGCVHEYWLARPRRAGGVLPGRVIKSVLGRRARASTLAAEARALERSAGRAPGVEPSPASYCKLRTKSAMTLSAFCTRHSSTLRSLSISLAAGSRAGLPASDSISAN